MPLLVLLLTSCVHPNLPEAVARSGPSSTVQVTMADGVKLHTRVFLPKGEGPWPVVFTRAPYDMAVVLNSRCRRFNRYGYACAWQMVRGRAPSEGEWIPFVHEHDDGLEALDWVIEQPWSDGNIALIGESYLAATQWAVAADLPEEVKTFVPTVVGTNLYEAAYEGGLFRHEIATAWMALMPPNKFRVFSGRRHYRNALAHRPRIEMDQVATGEELPWFRTWQRSDTPTAPFWSSEVARNGETAPSRTAVPVLMIAGWSDVFTGPQLDAWRELATQDDSTLVVGPWHHLGRVAADVKQAPVDDELGLWPSYMQWPRLLDWLDHHLKGEPSQYPVGSVLTFPMNGEGWVQRDTWPPPTTPRTFSLHPGESPQACTGRLDELPGEGEVGFTYDPEDPTPAHGGAGLLAGVLPTWNGVPPGFLDQGSLCEEREDLVGFRSAPLEDDLHVAGRISAKLGFASDAEDTAINVRVLEDRPDGRRILVRESILRLSLRDGARSASYTPGEVVTVPLETWPVDYIFEAGSRVLVEVGSVSWPKYEAHPNVAGPWYAATETRVANQRLVLSESTVTLPEDSTGVLLPTEH